jgi:hypothetical protein
MASSSGMVIAGASAKSPRMAKWMRGSTQGGDHDHGARVVRHAGRKLQPREAARRREPRGQALHHRDGEIGGRDEQQRGNRPLHQQAAPDAAHVRHGQGQQEHRDQADRAEVARGGLAEHQAPQA